MRQRLFIFFAENVEAFSDFVAFQAVMKLGV